MKLEIEKEKVLKAAEKCDTFKDIAKDLRPELYEFDPSKIYAFKWGAWIYKLHHTRNGNYGFQSMNDSRYYANGFDEPEIQISKAIESGRKVETFNTQKELFKWALKKCE